MCVRSQRRQVNRAPGARQDTVHRDMFVCHSLRWKKDVKANGVRDLLVFSVLRHLRHHVLTPVVVIIFNATYHNYMG